MKAVQEVKQQCEQNEREDRYCHDLEISIAGPGMQQNRTQIMHTSAQ
jgi:hypothetical protein